MLRTLLVAALVLVLAGPAAAGGSKADKKTKKLAASIQKKFADGRYVGVRGDGESLDYTFCANGRYTSNTGGGLSKGKRWKVVDPTGNAKNFKATVREGASGEFALARRNGQWQIGISFNGGYDYGDVTRTDAAADCKAL